MLEKKSVITLKGMVKKPAKPVTIAMMNEASKGPGGEKYQPTVKTKLSYKLSYKLSDLMAEMDPNAPVPEDIQAWMNMKPVGKEII